MPLASSFCGKIEADYLFRAQRPGTAQAVYSDGSDFLFPIACRPNTGPTQPPSDGNQWTFLWKYGTRLFNLTTHLHVVEIKNSWS